MKHNKLFGLFSILVSAAMVLTACAPAATAAPTVPPNTVATKASADLSASQTAVAAAPAATEAPAATAGPAPCPAPAKLDVASAPTTKAITLAFSQESDNVVTNYSNMTYSLWITQLVFAGLGRWDDKENYVTELGAEVPSADNGGVSADGLTITWHLKPCLFWSDGEPLTSKDVAFTWKSQMDPGNAPISRSAGWDKIDTIDTPDDTTAVIHFKELYPPWQAMWSQVSQGTAGALLPAHILEGHTGLEKDPFIHQPTVGSGPFIIKEWVAGDHMTLVANPNYVGGHPKLDAVNIKFVATPEAATAALQAGDVQFNPDYAEGDIPTIQAMAPAINLSVVATPSFEHLFFNLGTTAGVDGKGKSDVDGFCPFQDVNVRKAIMLGIDRQTIVDTLLYGKTTVPASLWPNSSWYNTSLTPYPYDKDQANTLLDAAGYKKGADGIRAGKCNGQDVKFSLGLETTTKQLRIDQVLAIKDMLAQVGIEVKPNHVPSGTFFGDYSSGADMQVGKFDMAIFTTGFYPDPDPSDYFLCTGIPNKDHPTGQNLYHVCDSKMEELFAQGLASADPATRKKAYDVIQQYQYDNVYFVPLYARANVSAEAATIDMGPFGANGYFAWNAVAWNTK